jgi:UDP-N-acetylglucosamine/UDP-N-acetylgalactosamine 4-epimerase
MNYLVTGGAGFIGSHIVEELLRRGDKVRVLDNLATGKRENVALFADRVEFIEGDIRSYHIVRAAVQGIDVVLHQAALPSVPRSVRDPITTHEVNATGTLNVLHAAKDAGVKRVVYACSSSVYGDSPELPKHEDMIPNPLSPYAVAKLAGEKYCGVFAHLYGLETVSLRYFNVFGPRQDANSQYSAVIPKFIKAMMADQAPTINGDGTYSRDFTYVANVVRANILAATVECDAGIVVNCACHGRITLNDLVAHINRLLGKNIQPIYAQPRPGDIPHSYADIRKAEELLGYKPIVGFEEGLKRTIEAMQSTVRV